MVVQEAGAQHVSDFQVEYAIHAFHVLVVFPYLDRLLLGKGCWTKNQILVVASSMFSILSLNIDNTMYAASTTICTYAKGVIISATIYL